MDSKVEKRKIFFNQSYKDLKNRLNINKINLNIIRNKVILDFGCGGGRYSSALLKIGAKTVDGFDFKKKPKDFPKNINYFRNILLSKKISKKYDFIFCNGILSHREDWKSIIISLSKVLKKGGYLWLSLYPHSKYWKEIDKITKNLKQTQQKNFEHLMRMRDWEEGKIYFISDILFSKRIYFKKEIIKFFLEKNKFINIKFLNRGIKNDLSEKVYKNLKYKKLFGHGEIRLIAKKL